MSTPFRRVALVAIVQAALVGRGTAHPPASSAPAPPRIVVHTPPAEVVVIEGDEKSRRLRLLGHCKKKEQPEPAPAAYYVQIPAMFPPAPRVACAPAAPPCAAPCASCGRPSGAPAGEGSAAVAAAGEDLRAAIERLKTLRAQREAEIAAIDTALGPVTPPASRAKVASAPAAGANRNEIRDLSDKLDYLAALIDALANDVRGSDPKRTLPSFDELNGLRKPKP